MEPDNPFAGLYSNTVESEQTQFQLPKVSVPWFDIDSYDPHNLRAHQEQTAAQESYIGEQFALAEHAFRTADAEADRAFAKAFVKARQTFIKRLSKKGSEEPIDVSDTMAKYLAALDENVILATAARDLARFERDRWKSYQKAMSSKISLLLCISGVHRDELKAIGRY